MNRRGFIKSVFGIAAGTALAPLMPKVAKAGTIKTDKAIPLPATNIDRISCRRLLIYIKNSIEKGLKPFMFEPNDAQTRRAMKKCVTTFLKGIQKKTFYQPRMDSSGKNVTMTSGRTRETVIERSMIDSFKVVCDETNNNPDVVDANSAIMDIYLKDPAGIFIVLHVVVGSVASYRGADLTKAELARIHR